MVKLKSKPLGEGTYGVVHRGYKILLSERKRLVAIKVTNPSCGSDAVEALANEAKMLKRLKHESIVRFVDFCLMMKRPEHPALILELCSEGDLYDFIKKGKFSAMSLPEIVDLMLDVISALEFMHANGILCLDIKTSNIFLERRGGEDRQLMVKVGDLGLACDIDNYAKSCPCGTIKYMARKYGDASVCLL